MTVGKRLLLRSSNQPACWLIAAAESNASSPGLLAVAAAAAHPNIPVLVLVPAAAALDAVSSETAANAAAGTNSVEDGICYSLITMNIVIIEYLLFSGAQWAVTILLAVSYHSYHL